MRVAILDRPGDALEVAAASEAWARLLGVNLMGVLNGTQSFAPAMVEGSAPGLVINTGSKQGITQPPGNTAYNVSKAGVKALTEELAHTLRERTGDPGERAPADSGLHLERHDGGSPIREACGSLDARAGGRADAGARRGGRLLYPLPGRRDHARAGREADRLGGGRRPAEPPALSRWHPDWKDAFERHMAG